MSFPRTVSRRELLTTATGLVGAGLAGCLAVGGESVRVLSAGSLANTFENHVGPAFEDERGIDLRGQYFGTNTVVRLVEDRTKRPDVIVGADATLVRTRLAEFLDWDVVFASNALGIGYNPETALGEALAGDDPWYEVLAGGRSGLAISDPDLDPLGYRAVQAFELAEREHDLTGFKSAVLDSATVEPEEPQLMAEVGTGSVAAAVVYRNMAVDHDLPFIEFPPAYNFADPAHAEGYATATYTTDEGTTIPGRPILYNATVPESADSAENGRALVEFLVDNPDILTEAGLTVTDALPTAHGAVPEGIAQ